MVAESKVDIVDVVYLAEHFIPERKYLEWIDRGIRRAGNTNDGYSPATKYTMRMQYAANNVRHDIGHFR
jgi:hypothetical protein